MRIRRRVAAVTMVCSAALAGLSGCGDEHKDGDSGTKPPGTTNTSVPPSAKTNGLEALSAQEISDRAQQALLDAPSVTLDFQPEPSAKEMPAGKLAMDEDGDCVGKLGTPGDGQLEIIKIGKKVWLKPDTLFWKTQVGGADGKAAAELFKGRYLQTTSDDKDFGDAIAMCDLDAFAKESGDDSGTLTKGESTRLDGVPVVTIVETNGQERSVVSVAATGEPYPLKIDTRGGKDEGTIFLRDYGKPVPKTPPPADEVVDMSKFEKEIKQG